MPTVREQVLRPTIYPLFQDKPPLTSQDSLNLPSKFRYSKATSSSFPHQMGRGGVWRCRGTHALKCPGINYPLAGSGSLYRSTPRFLAQEPLSKAPNAQASSSSQSATTGTELPAKGQGGVEKRDTSYPTPISSPLLGFSPCPVQGCATRGQRPHRSGSRPGRRAPLTPCPRPPGRAKAPAGASRGLPPHFSRSGWISSSTCSNRPGDRPGGKRVATASSHLPGAPSDPALAQPQTPRRAGPGPQTPPYPRREQRRSARFPSRRRHSLSRSCPPLGEWEEWLGGGCYYRLKGEEETETGTTAAA